MGMNDGNEAFVRDIEGGGWKPPANPGELPDGVRDDFNPVSRPPDEQYYMESEDFSNLPEEARDKFKARDEYVKKLEKQNEILLSQLTRGQEMLSEAHDRVMRGSEKQASGDDEGFSRFSDAQLNEYISGAERIQAAVLTNPDNEEVRAEASKINPAHLRAVREELTRRMIAGEVGGLRSELSKREESSILSRKAEKLIADEFGYEALMNRGEGTPISRAQEIVSDMQKQFPGKFWEENPGAAAMAAVLGMRLAHAEQGNRAGERRSFPASAVRQLDIEGRGRRETGYDSERSAMIRRGDWDKVLYQDVDRMLRGMGT